jgi:hypothetical protein
MTLNMMKCCQITCQRVCVHATLLWICRNTGVRKMTDCNVSKISQQRRYRLKRFEHMSEHYTSICLG